MITVLVLDQTKGSKYDNLTEDQFEHLEEEVLDIEEEFASLANKLNQLKNIPVNSVVVVENTIFVLSKSSIR
jgi:hypothetical protein